MTDRNLVLLLDRLVQRQRPSEPDGKPLGAAIARALDFRNRYQGEKTNGPANDHPDL
jgi:hypothetical protein